MSQPTVTLRVPADILSDLEIVAEATQQSRSYVVLRAIHTYLKNEGADILAEVKSSRSIGEAEKP